MNLRDLDYVLAVAELGHFGEAAVRCNVSQPTLSTQIRKLEAEIGVVLFERGTKRAMPTEAGQVVIAQARIVVDQALRLRELAGEHHNPLGGRLRLGVIPTSGPYLLPHLLPVLRRRFPALKLLLREAMTARLTDLLHRAELDAAILSLPIDQHGLDLAPIGEEAFLIALPPDHRLAARERVAPAELAGETVLTLEEGHCLREQAAAICREVGLAPDREVQASSVESLRQMVSIGLGCAILPAFAGKGPFAQGAPVVLRPLEQARPSRALVLVWRRSDPREAALRQLGAVLAEAVAAI
jgi:LysR family hydrogen peroxide-inducible transcriptional activator